MKKFFIYLLILLVLGAGMFYWIQEDFVKKISLLENPNWVYPTVATTTTGAPWLPGAISEIGDPPPNYIKYENKKFGFSYYHSKEAKIKEFDEGSGAMTIVQENIQNMRGLQIFIVPYDKDIITEEQFLKDVPSGVRYNIAQTTVGDKKVPAVAFNSYDKFLGETREVWFIYNGYLFEVTTFKGFAEWFVPIMKTWRFL